jgi:hypothetical protein
MIFLQLFCFVGMTSGYQEFPSTSFSRVLARNVRKDFLQRVIFAG